MRGEASYSVRGGSLRVRKVVATNSQGKKKTKSLACHGTFCPPGPNTLVNPIKYSVPL